MKAAREEAGCAALPEAPPEVLVLSFLLLDTGCSALFEAAREEAGRFIAVVTIEAGKNSGATCAHNKLYAGKAEETLA